MVTIKTNWANSNNYGPSRNSSNIKYIVIHYTGNDGDTDEGNGIYFHNNNVGVGAHYFVDSDSITHSVPDTNVGWSVGGSKYNDCSQTGGGKYYNKCTNYNSISIELTDDNKNGVIHPSNKTINNALDLTRLLMKKYNVPLNNVIRHFDVNGKRCPDYWCGNSTKNQLWLTEFKNKINQTNEIKEEVKENVNVKININIKGITKVYDAKNVKGTNYVKAREFLTNLGYTVGFDNNKKRVKANNIVLDIATIIENGNSFIHLRDCINFLNKYDNKNFTIDYNKASKLITIK